MTTDGAVVGPTAGEELFEAVEGSALWEEMVEREDTDEGGLYSPVSPHHFWRADWGSDLRRHWGADGTLRVRRCYQAEAGPEAPRLEVCEVPFAPRCVGTGGVVWPAALALARYLYGQRTALGLGALRNVLEIGAGSGIPGLYIASLVASLAVDSECKVFLTDENQCILANLRDNVAANSEAIAARVHVAHFAWEDFLQGAAPPPAEAVDLLIGSDVIWGDRGVAVARLALRLVRPGGSLVVSAKEGRDGLDHFESILLAGCDGDVGQGFEGNAGPPFSVELLREDSYGEPVLIYACCRDGAP